MRPGVIALEEGPCCLDDGSRTSLEAIEFIRRFLLHVLPSGFVKIRHFGFLSNRNRKQMVQHCRELLPPSSVKAVVIEPRLPLCPICKVGHLLVIDWGRKPMTTPTVLSVSLAVLDSS